MKSLKYPALVILSAILYGTAPSLTKLTYEYGGNAMTLSVLTPLFAIPCFWLMGKGTKQSFRLERPMVKKLILMATFGSSAGTILLFFSYEYISVGMATSLHFIYPIVVAFALVLFFRERMNAWKIAALAVSVAGIAAVSLEEISTSPLGILLALLSGVCYGFNVIYLDKSGLGERNPYVICCYAAVVNTVVAAAVGLLLGRLNPLTTASAWIAAFLSSLIGRVAALPCFQVGMRGTGSLAAGVLSTFEPIVSVLIGVLILRESATVGKLIGCLLVVAGVCLIVCADRKAAQASSLRTDSPDSEF